METGFPHLVQDQASPLAWVEPNITVLQSLMDNDDDDVMEEEEDNDDGDDDVIVIT